MKQRRSVIQAELIEEITDPHRQKIEYRNCDFDDISLLNLKDIGIEIMFSECTFRKLRIHNCIFDHNFLIFRSQFLEDIYISTSTFFRPFACDNCSFTAISVNGSKFLDGFYFYDFTCKLKAVFSFYINENTIKIGNKSATDITEKIEVNFYDTSKSAVQLINLIAKEISIEFRPVYTNEPVTIANIKTEKLTINQCMTDTKGVTILEDIVVKDIILNQIHNNGLLNIRNLRGTGEGEFSLNHSYLGKCELYNTDFKSFKNINVNTSQLLSIVPIDVKWNFNDEAYNKMKNTSLHSLFRQLKIISNTNKDRFSELQFAKLEMKYYARSLSLKNNLGDYFILWSNRWSNNHGESYIRPAMLMILFSAVFYNALVIAAGTHNSCWHIGNAIAFINPIHNLKDVLCDPTGIKNSWIYLWDMLQRIFSSYFIFQFLRAFRKFVN